MYLVKTDKMICSGFIIETRLLHWQLGRTRSKRHARTVSELLLNLEAVSETEMPWTAATNMEFLLSLRMSDTSGTEDHLLSNYGRENS